MARKSLALVTFSSIFFGCVSKSPLYDATSAVSAKTIDKPLVVGIEGLGGGYSVRNLVSEIAYERDILQSSSAGNPSRHIRYIEEASRKGLPIYLVGFSSGANEVRIIADICQERGINIDTMFFLDPTYISRPFPKKIPENVREVVCFLSYEPDWLVGGALKKQHLANNSVKLENIEVYSSHLSLPQNQKVKKIIKDKITNPSSTLAKN